MTATTLNTAADVVRTVRTDLAALSDGELLAAWKKICMSAETRATWPPGQRERAIKLANADTPYINSSIKRIERTQATIEAAAKVDIPVAKRSPIDWAELTKRGEPPARRWAIGGWWGFGHSTSMVGSGGIGKTLVAQQMASCLALGRKFIGDVAAPLRILMWACEDDSDELWRRQLAIARWLGVPLSDFADNLIIEPRAGLENTLASSEYSRLVYTPLIEELRQQAGDYRADAVILDNTAQLFGGNENDRHQVTSFLNNLTGTLQDKAVLLLAHPSRSAGSEFSGSSAWEAVVRTRLFLGSKLPDQAANDDEPDDTVRYLCRRKANYSSKDYRRFQYRDGVLIPDEFEATASGGILDHLRQQKAERVILDGLGKLSTMEVRAVDSANSPAFLPRLLLEYKLGDGCTKKELADAMRTAMLDGKLIRGVVGKYSNRSSMHGLMVAA
jgi:RecA-family ATPase